MCTSQSDNVTPNCLKTYFLDQIKFISDKKFLGGGGYGPEEKFTHFHCQSLAGLEMVRWFYVTVSFNNVVNQSMWCINIYILYPLKF